MMKVFNTVKAIGYKNGDAPRLTSNICLVRDEALDAILLDVAETVRRFYEGTNKPEEEIESRAIELMDDAEFCFGEGAAEWSWKTADWTVIWQLTEADIPDGLEGIFEMEDDK